MRYAIGGGYKYLRGNFNIDNSLIEEILNEYYKMVQGADDYNLIFERLRNSGIPKDTLIKVAHIILQNY